MIDEIQRICFREKEGFWGSRSERRNVSAEMLKYNRVEFSSTAWCILLHNIIAFFSIQENGSKRTKKSVWSENNERQFKAQN